VLKTSPIDTPIIFARSRSMSRKSQGVLARKLEKSPWRPAVSVASATTVSVTACRASRPLSPGPRS
jgi:hypothetical protein